MEKQVYISYFSHVQSTKYEVGIFVNTYHICTYVIRLKREKDKNSRQEDRIWFMLRARLIIIHKGQLELCVCVCVVAEILCILPRSLFSCFFPSLSALGSRFSALGVCETEYMGSVYAPVL